MFSNNTQDKIRKELLEYLSCIISVSRKKLLSGIDIAIMSECEGYTCGLKPFLSELDTHNNDLRKNIQYQLIQIYKYRKDEMLCVYTYQAHK